MGYPILAIPETYRQTLSVFGGYNHNLSIGDGEFYDMQNLTGQHYPVLSPRQGRGVYQSGGSFTGLIAKDALCYCQGQDFFINGYKVESFTLCTGCDTCPNAPACVSYVSGKTSCPKQLVSMGAYVLIFPDKLYINTQNHADKGSLEARFAYTGQLQLQLCHSDATAFPENIPTQKPEDPGEGAYWLDISGNTPVLKCYSAQSALWLPVEDTRVKIAAPGIGAVFSQGDGVILQGLAGAVTQNEVDTAELKNLDGVHTICQKDRDFILISGFISTAMTVTADLEVTRPVPHMDYVAVCQNRLWGCRYGTDRQGRIVNEIYGSKLGDFKNFYAFSGISTDSWAGSVGTDGAFTGAAVHLGYPLFFKENCLHRVLISDAGGHGIEDTPCQGVQSGCHKSLALVGTELYYKARSGICRFDGSLPVEISQKLGNKPYCNAVGGSFGADYYISMENDAGEKNLFVYDTYRKLWHRQDSLPVEAFCTCRDTLYAIAGEQIVMLRGSYTPTEESVCWQAQTGQISVTQPDMSYLHRLNVSLQAQPGAKVSFFVRYDWEGGWKQLYTFRAKGSAAVDIPLRPRRCHHLYLKIQGQGDVKIFCLTKTFTKGSDCP